MPVQLIEEQVLKFLNSPSPGTISIRGAWGVGKTYAWRAYIKNAVSKEKLPNNERYSYVSLFGIDSLQDFKFQIFQQAIPKKMVNEEVTIKSFGDNAREISESFGRKSFRSLLKLPYVINFSDFLHSVAFLSVNKSLICIDDLERKGKNLSMSDVLGLVSHLKEEKKCKIVLIHNEAALNKPDQCDFDKYREKVIDFEYEYKPSPSECIKIAFTENCDFRKSLAYHCNRLRIDNIRILKKIEEFAKHLIPHIQGFEPEISNQALHTLCLFAWCLYSPDDVSPSYDYVTNMGLKLTGLGDKDTSTESDKRWNPILQNYGYVYPDELDLAIGHFIKTGYVIEGEFNPAAKKKNEEVISMKGHKSLKEAWGIYHNSFKNNEEEVVKQIFEALKKGVKYASPLDLQGTVKVLRELKRDDLADDAIEYYIAQRISEKKSFDPRTYPFLGDITDETIINRFKEVLVSNIDRPSLEEVFKNISRDSFLKTPEFEQTLLMATVDDYCKLFKSKEGKGLSEYINNILQFDGSGKVAAALKMIGKECPINKLRVKKYGVHIDEDEL